MFDPKWHERRGMTHRKGITRAIDVYECESAEALTPELIEQMASMLVNHQIRDQGMLMEAAAFIPGLDATIRPGLFSFTALLAERDEQLSVSLQDRPAGVELKVSLIGHSRRLATAIGKYPDRQAAIRMTARVTMAAMLRSLAIGRSPADLVRHQASRPTLQGNLMRYGLHIPLTGDGQGVQLDEIVPLLKDIGATVGAIRKVDLPKAAAHFKSVVTEAGFECDVHAGTGGVYIRFEQPESAASKPAVAKKRRSSRRAV